jgi:aspartyl-tRNA(Asn)/glutamyl-tRNA(Gln) amidotransferase subunit B
MPVKLDEAWKAAIRATIPEHHFDRQRRYFDKFQLPYTQTSVLIADPRLCAFFEEAAQASGKPQAAANFIANNLSAELAAAGIDLEASKVRPAHVAGLVKLVDGGVISSNIAKEVFVTMFQSGEMPEAIVEKQGLRQSTDTGELEKWIADAIAGNPAAAAQFKAGNEKALNAIKGAVMKASKGKANPQLVDEITRKQLAG